MKSFKQYISEVQRYEYGDDDIWSEMIPELLYDVLPGALGGGAGWQFGVGGAFLVTPSDEPEEVESETAPGSEGIEAIAPYRLA